MHNKTVTLCIREKYYALKHTQTNSKAGKEGQMIRMILCKVHYNEFKDTEYAKRFDVIEGSITECEFCIERRNNAITENTTQGEEYDIGDEECDTGGT